MEEGPCNVSTLHRILERVQPEVIFLEIPPFCFDQFFMDKTRSNLEANAVNSYLKMHRAAPVPVDVMEASSELIAEHQHLRREIRARSPEYCQLMHADSNFIARHGFAYLNSKYCVELWSNVDASIEEALERIGDTNLLRGYKNWKDVHEYREQQMLENIQHYCEKHPVSRGVFLLGAAHRRSIMEKAVNLSYGRSIAIDWNFSQYEGLLDGWRTDAASI